MRPKTWLLGILCCALWACGDDEAEGEKCPAGSTAGAVFPCTCGEDAGPTGRQMCKDDNTLTACDCETPTAGAGGAGAGGESGAGSGGAGSSGEGGAGSGGAGAGGAGSDGDSGVPEDGGLDASDDAGAEPSDLPEDGDQSAVCDDNESCNDGLACFDQGEGQAFCSAECMMDEDCEEIDGAEWSCSMGAGVCVVECTDEDDEDSCPDAMVCVQTQGGGGGQGGPTFRCKYPEPAGTQGPFEACEDDGECEEGLYCQASSAQGAQSNGYCTMECGGGDECTIDAPSGDLEVSCGASTSGGADRCVLDCEGDEEGCPDGMACLMYGEFMRCGFD